MNGKDGMVHQLMKVRILPKERWYSFDFQKKLSEFFSQSTENRSISWCAITLTSSLTGPYIKDPCLAIYSNKHDLCGDLRCQLAHRPTFSPCRCRQHLWIAWHSCHQSRGEKLNCYWIQSRPSHLSLSLPKLTLGFSFFHIPSSCPKLFL